MHGDRSVWVFDVDATLFDGLSGSSLRPGTRSMLGQIRAMGCEIVLWSSGGADYAERRAEAAGIAALFDRFAGKGPLIDGRHRLDDTFGPASRAVFVDDRVQELPAEVEAIAVRPYLAHDPHDRGLRPVLERLAASDGG